VAANNFSDREEAASKIGSFAICCPKSPIAARLATSGSFTAVYAITGNTSTTTSKLEAVCSGTRVRKTLKGAKEEIRWLQLRSFSS